jgi:hypothetical protein
MAFQIFLFLLVVCLLLSLARLGRLDWFPDRASLLTRNGQAHDAPLLHLGPRTQNLAHSVIHSLRELLAPGCLPLFTSDGLNLYFYAARGPFWTLARGRSPRTA